MDKLRLVLVAIAVSAIIGMFFWLFNRVELPGGNVQVGIILALIAWIVQDRMRIRELERVLKDNGIEPPWP